jgi:hypothetical protein
MIRSLLRPVRRRNPLLLGRQCPRPTRQWRHLSRRPAGRHRTRGQPDGGMADIGIRGDVQHLRHRPGRHRLLLGPGRGRPARHRHYQGPLLPAARPAPARTRWPVGPASVHDGEPGTLPHLRQYDGGGGLLLGQWFSGPTRADAIAVVNAPAACRAQPPAVTGLPRPGEARPVSDEPTAATAARKPGDAGPRCVPPGAAPPSRPAGGSPGSPAG